MQREGRTGLALVVTWLAILAVCLLLFTGRVSLVWSTTNEVTSEALTHRRLLDLAQALGISGLGVSSSENAKTNTDNEKVMQAFTFGPEKFKKLAYAVVAPLQPTDKVTTHTYHTMYGIFLYPLLARARRFGKKLKFFEIGMGCGMTYGPGRSVALWKGLWGDSISLWEADLDPNCVKRMQDEGLLPGVNMLVGNQKNPAHLQRWLDESGGAFDIIIDDGGHMNHEIKATFDFWWPHLNPGGLYFLEDLAVGRMVHNKDYGHYDETGGQAIMSDIIQTWIEQLIIPELKIGDDPAVKIRREKFPVPKGLKWIFCQAEACLLAKCLPEDKEIARCMPFQQ